MELLIISQFVSWLVWGLAAIRQRHCYYALFFLTLALADPTSFILRKIIIVPPSKIFNLFTVAALYSFYKTEGYFYFKKLKPEIGLIFLFPLFFNNSPYYMKIYLMLLELMVLAEFLKRFFIVAVGGVFNLFYLVLLIYELSIVIKYLFLFTGTRVGIEYYATTSILQIAIALFFIIFKENNPKLLINLPKSIKID